MTIGLIIIVMRTCRPTLIKFYAFFHNGGIVTVIYYWTTCPV